MHATASQACPVQVSSGKWVLRIAWHDGTQSCGVEVLRAIVDVRMAGAGREVQMEC